MAEFVTARSPKRMEVAVLLAVFLGPLGVFYSSIERFVAACIEGAVAKTQTIETNDRR